VRGLRKDEDLTFIVGRTLEQVCFGQFQISLRFNDEVTVDVESSIMVGGTEVTTSTSARLLAFLGGIVAAVSVVGEGDLDLSFEGRRERLLIRDSNRDYESYSITFPGRTIVV
jgi:hypothetical protein